MCLALPAQIITIDQANDEAIISLDGVKKKISLALVENVTIGDFVLIHVGYALNTISEEEAERTLSLMRESGLLNEAMDEIGETA